MATYQITINERTKEGKELLAQLKKNKTVQFKQKEKLNDPTKMTKAEFYAKIARAHINARKGHFTEVKHEDIHSFLESL